MNHLSRERVMDITADALNWVWDHILRNSHDGSLLDTFGWWLDARLSAIFSLAYRGSDFELKLAEDGCIPDEHLSDRQRAHLARAYPRYCTDHESESLQSYLCPICGTQTLLEGPRGGECVNVMCERCRSKWNIAPVGCTCQAIDPPLALSVQAHA